MGEIVLGRVWSCGNRSSPLVQPQPGQHPSILIWMQAVIEPKESCSLFSESELIEKEAEAKKGTTKLLLLNICSNFDEQNWTAVSNLLAAIPSQGMEVVTKNPHAVRAQAFFDLMRQTIDVTKQHNTMLITFHYITIQLPRSLI